MGQCKKCERPLTIMIDWDDEASDPDQAGASSENEVPDSVELQYAYEITRCPSCSKDVLNHAASGEERILCNVNNEGGLQEAFDILPILKEESFLKAFPEERKARALLEFCAEGDVGAILDLVKGGEDEDDDFSMDGSDNAEGAAKPIDVLRYQDPTGSMDTGLHVAIRNGQEEVVWLLLLLASSLELHRFPPDVIQAAETLGAVREDQVGKVDVRVLENAEHMTAVNLAQKLGGKWEAWIAAGRLKPVWDGIVPVIF
ncbi:MAG: hypothetical protein LQ348_001249 [Seirophora lacunosa]|nr:MAG: hypothetical protein LQ348_001249 [Seirophora lacunosa]